MHKAFKVVIEPLNNSLGEELARSHAFHSPITLEPTYLTYQINQNGKWVRKVEVQSELSEYVIWNIKGNRMIKKYDRNQLMITRPF